MLEKLFEKLINTHTEAFETAAASIGNKVTATGSLGTLFSWAASFDYGMWMGVLIGIGGLVVNWYYKRQTNNREKKESAARLLESSARIRRMERDSGHATLSPTGRYAEE